MALIEVRKALEILRLEPDKLQEYDELNSEKLARLIYLLTMKMLAILTQGEDENFPDILRSINNRDDFYHNSDVDQGLPIQFLTKEQLFQLENQADVWQQLIDIGILLSNLHEQYEFLQMLEDVQSLAEINNHFVLFETDPNPNPFKLYLMAEVIEQFYLDEEKQTDFESPEMKDREFSYCLTFFRQKAAQKYDTSFLNDFKWYKFYSHKM